MKIISKKFLSDFLTTGSITVYADGTARLRIRVNGKLIHDKIHKNENAAKAAWYRVNA